MDMCRELQRAHIGVDASDMAINLKRMSKIQRRVCLYNE